MLFSGFLPFSPAINFISQFLHTYLIHLVSFHFIRHMMVRQMWSAGILPINITSIKGLHRISSHDTALCSIRVEDIFFLPLKRDLT